MAELNIRLDIRLTPRVFKSALAILLISGLAQELASESVTLTTYYPAPSGVYTQMITTSNTFLARDGGNVSIQTTQAGSRLNVNGNASIGNGYTATAAPANGMLVQGSVGIGNNAPKSMLDVTGGVSIGTYGGVTAAPANSLIVSGNIGAGIATPGSAGAASSNWFATGNLNDGRNTADGITWYSPAPTSYGIYRTAGAWSAPNYTQLESAWSTGIIIDGGSAYGLSGTIMQPGAGTVSIGLGVAQGQATLDVGGVIANHVSPAVGNTCAAAGICHFGAGAQNCPANTFATLTSGFMAKYQLIDYPGASAPGTAGDATGEMICETCPAFGCPAL